MIGLGLKILGIGLAGSALSYGAYLGIEDMKWKASTDYPAYYWNKYYREVYENTTDEDNVVLNYDDEAKWKKLHSSKSISNSEYAKNKSEFSNLGEDWQKYRQWCLTYLRKFVMNGIGDKNIINNYCVFDAKLRQEFSNQK